MSKPKPFRKVVEGWTPRPLLAAPTPLSQLESHFEHRQNGRLIYCFTQDDLDRAADCLTFIEPNPEARHAE